ncbi:MAG: hypothetical protein ACRELB_14920 [Polyangiaceae bacterium]
MSSFEPMRAGARPPSRLAVWQIATAILSGVAMAPVIGLIVVFFLASAAPVIPLLAAMLVTQWARHHDQAPTPRPRHAPPSIWRPDALRHA